MSKYQDGEIVWYACRWRFVVESFSYTEYLRRQHKQVHCSLELDASYTLYLLALCCNPLEQKLGFEYWIDCQQKKRPRVAKKHRCASSTGR